VIVEIFDVSQGVRAAGNMRVKLRSAVSGKRHFKCGAKRRDLEKARIAAAARGIRL